MVSPSLLATEAEPSKNNSPSFIFYATISHIDTSMSSENEKLNCLQCSLHSKVNPKERILQVQKIL